MNASRRAGDGLHCALRPVLLDFQNLVVEHGECLLQFVFCDRHPTSHVLSRRPLRAGVRHQPEGHRLRGVRARSA